jgi:hypothetical protein
LSVECGGTYKVFYDAATLRWGGIGPNKTLIDSKAKVTESAFMNPGPAPTQRSIVLWGLTFDVSDSYEAKLHDGPVVGHLVAGQP